MLSFSKKYSDLSKNLKILVMGDAHVAEKQSLKRFKLASKLIIEQRPDYVVSIGDFLTLNCLSAWDMDKRLKMEGRRYLQELEAGNKALDLLQSEVIEYNKEQKSKRKKLYCPQWIFIEGNHEERLPRYLEKDPTFVGMVDIQKDLHLESRNFIWVPYRNYIYINDIGFTHVPFNKVSPISGVDITRKAQSVTIKSCVFGHTHEWHISNRHIEGMEHLQQTLNCGCYFEENEDYVQGKVTNYWKGLMMLESYKPGRFDLTTYSLGRLERMYGEE